MNAVSVCGLIVAIVGAMALVASSSATLKGNREYTYKAGIVLACVGLVMVLIGERFI